MTLTHQQSIDAFSTVLRDTVNLASRTPPDLQIPTCGEWEARDLWEHLGQVHRWATLLIATHSREYIKRRDVEIEEPRNGDWAQWLESGGTRLVSTLAENTGDEAVWSWGDDHHVRWWSRRQLHETIIHNADAALAMGQYPDIPAELAADCLDELLDNQPANAPRGEPDSNTFTVHLHATDDGLGEAGEWMISVEDGDLTYTHAHGKGDVALQGSATELLLCLANRLDLDDAEIKLFGDEQAMRSLIELAAL